MKPPILIFDNNNNDLMVFETIESAESGIEVDDIKYVIAYDCEGYLIDIIGYRFPSKITIREHIPLEVYSESLKNRLVLYLTHMKVPYKDIEKLSLKDLVSLAWNFMPWA